MRIYLHLGKTPTMHKRKTCKALAESRKNGTAKKLNRLDIMRLFDAGNSALINLKGK
jgi:hypothetical protein